MKLRDFGLFTDENVDPVVIAFLRRAGFDVLDVCESDLQGTADPDVLRLACAAGRVAVTHDNDLGALAVGGEPAAGVVCLRPGHIPSSEAIDTVHTVLARDPDVFPPFLLVAKRAGGVVTVRVRDLRPGP